MPTADAQFLTASAPNEKGPWRRSKVGLLAVEVDGMEGCHNVDVRTEENEVDKNVDKFEANPVPPGGGHCECHSEEQ